MPALLPFATFGLVALLFVGRGVDPREAWSATALGCGVFVTLGRWSRMPLLYLTAAASTFLPLAIALKWQPWLTRLHLVAFLLAAPLFGVAAESPRRTWLPEAMGAVLAFWAAPWLLGDATRPLVGESSNPSSAPGWNSISPVNRTWRPTIARRIE